MNALERAELDNIRKERKRLLGRISRAELRIAQLTRRLGEDNRMLRRLAEIERQAREDARAGRLID